MKTTKINSTLLLAGCLSASILFGCQKENVTKPSTQTNGIVANQLNSDASVIRTSKDDNQVITLIPGLKDGQDVPCVFDAGRAQSANENQNQLQETAAFGWTNSGAAYKLRSFLRFDSMVLIPVNAHIISSTLYLYGLTSAVSTPQGNSYYPGSPYNQFGPNSCTVSRALSMWNESTLTWNNQPATTTFNQAVIPASTSQWNYNVEVDVTALTRQYVKHPELNFGVCIKIDNENPYHCIVFGSSEQANVNLRPKLVVVYN